MALVPASVALQIAFVVHNVGAGHTAWAIDFAGNLRVPAQEILRGDSPYHPAELAHVRDAVAAGHSPFAYHHGVYATYPAPSLLAGVPFTALPFAVAAWLWFGCLLAAGGVALRLAGVRDRRVYAVALFAPPVLGSLYYGSIDLVLMLGLAACWRWRDRAGPAGIALGAIIALKLIALPLVVWLVATRRWRAAAVSLAVGGCVMGAGWALIGFHGLAGYPHLLSLLTDIESSRGFSAVAYATALGASPGVAAFAPYVVGAVLVAALVRASRRHANPDAAGFLFGVLAILAFSPIVWQHTVTLLLVPLAVLRPRFGPFWVIPLLLWIAPDTVGATGALQLVVFAIVVTALCVRALALAARPEAPGAGLSPSVSLA